MDESENVGWLLQLFMLTVLLALVVWITFLSLDVFWSVPFFRLTALAGFVLVIALGAYFALRSSQELRDRIAFGGFTLITVVIFVWFLSMLGARFGWWIGLKISSPL